MNMDVVYKKKNVNPKLIVALIAGVLAFAFLVMAGGTIYHIAV